MPHKPLNQASKKSATPPSDWNNVNQWYDELVGNAGSSHHQKVIIPGVMRLLNLAPPARVLDIAAGQGVLCRALSEQGLEVTGVDLAPELIKAARQRCASALEHHVLGDARKLGEIAELANTSFDAAICVLAIQNMTPLSPVWQGCRQMLKPGGVLVVVMMHPCFRVPRASNWGWDEVAGSQYRRVDRYLTSEKIAIAMHPGSEPTESTLSFHRPLQAYINTLGSAGLMIDHIEEWISHKHPPQGKRFTAMDKSRREIPLFLALRARRSVVDQE